MLVGSGFLVSDDLVLTAGTNILENGKEITEGLLFFTL
jgi:hypothetical protein